jgi:tRNA pseudouridine55 synthase
MDGLLVIDKPAGPTSHDVVARVRRALCESRVGHTGTLDPAATGVLPLVIGRATRLARFLNASDKVYEAVLRLGVTTDTYDGQGTPTRAPHSGPWPSRDAIDDAVDAFRGSFLQQPPAFSAKKIGGIRSYVLARAGACSPANRERAGQREPGCDAAIIEGSRPLPKPVPVTAHRLEVVAVDGDRVTLRVECSAGFYVRSLAHEVGERLGTGAHLAALRRMRSGLVDLSQAVALDVVERDPHAARAAVVPLADMLPSLNAVVLTEQGVRRLMHGRDLGQGDTEADVIPVGLSLRLLDKAGHLIGIGEPSETPGLLHPSVVLV